MNSGIPAVSCTCGQRHHLHSNYYVSASDDGTQARALLLAGPYRTHQETLALVSVANRIVCERYNPRGEADWYAWGTVAMAHDYTAPGKIQAEVDDALLGPSLPIRGRDRRRA